MPETGDRLARGPGRRGPLSVAPLGFGLDMLPAAGRGLASASHVPLVENAVDVALGGPHRDAQPARDGHCQLVGLRPRSGAVRTACSWLGYNGDAGDLGPNLKGLGPGGSILDGRPLMAAEQEKGVDPVVGGQEALRQRPASATGLRSAAMGGQRPNAAGDRSRSPRPNSREAGRAHPCGTDARPQAPRASPRPSGCRVAAAPCPTLAS